MTDSKATKERQEAQEEANEQAEKDTAEARAKARRDNRGDLFVVLDEESLAVEYGPASDKDAAVTHLAKMNRLDLRGELAADVGRVLGVFKLTPVKVKDEDVPDFRVATDRVDRSDRTSAENAGDEGVEPLGA